MKTDDAPVLDGRRAFFGALLGGSLFAGAAVIFLPRATIAFGTPLFAGVMIGLPTGIAATLARSSFRAAFWSAASWGLVSFVIQASILMGTHSEMAAAKRYLAHLAFLLTIVSIAALCGGCAQMLCRAIPARGERAKPFQFSLSEALVFSVVFALALGGGAWLARLAPDVIRDWSSIASHAKEAR